MKIIVMAAGRGERYRKEGFTISKPLVEFKGKPMINHVISQFYGVANFDDIIVVGTESVCNYIDLAFPTIKKVAVHTTQNGPGMSVLLAGGLIEDSEPVLLIDSDSILGSKTAKDMLPETGVGKVACRYIEGSTLPYSTVTLNDDGSVESIEEKTGRSSLICVGMYSFSSWESLRRSIARFTCCFPDKEVYIAPLMNSQPSIKAVCVDQWVNLGTPSDLRQAMNK